jgi:hypothetical protein
MTGATVTTSSTTSSGPSRGGRHAWRAIPVRRRAAIGLALGCSCLLGTGYALSVASAGSLPGGVPGSVSLDASAAPPSGFSVPDRTSASGKRITALTASTAANATAAARSDLNGDGTSDLVYRIHTGDVYLDTGTGTDPVAVITSDSSQVKDLLLPGDLTGDGTPDLLTVTASGALRLHSGAGAATEGGLNAFKSLSSGWQAYNKILAPGDLNGDAHPDLLARSVSGLYLFLGTGDTAAPFGAAKKVGGTGWSQFDELVGADDLNGDGLADVIARSSTGLYLYPGNGSTTSPFGTRTQIGGAGWSQYNQIVGGADYDGDAAADLMARGYDGTLYFYAGNGTGAFAARAASATGWGTAGQFAGAGNPPAFGKTGLVARTSAGVVYYYDSTGTGRFSARQQVGTGWTRSAYRLAHVSSLREEGTSDLVVHNVSDGHLYNIADYAVSDPQIAGGSTAYNLVVGPGDLNGDGLGDMIARSSTALYFYAGVGDGLSVQGRVSVGGSGWSQYNTLVGAGDFTSDGRADLLARSSQGLFLYKGTGSAASPFASRVQIGGSGWSQYTQIAAPGDVNGDGIADLVASNSAGELWFYAGSGNAAAPLKAKVRIGTGGWSQYPDLR